MNADWVEEFFVQQLCQFLCSFNSVYENNGLIESQRVQQVSEFLKLFVFLNVNEKLGQSVKNEFSFINEDINFILQEFFAIFFQLLRHCGTEHHDLFIMWSLDEDLLDVGSHAGVS